MLVQEPILHRQISWLMCRELIRLASQSQSGILLTSYDQLRIQRAELLFVNWGYAILDEGHKIRNPDAEVSFLQQD